MLRTCSDSGVDSSQLMAVMYHVLGAITFVLQHPLMERLLSTDNRNVRFHASNSKKLPLLSPTSASPDFALKTVGRRVHR
jgi:hypothetical protein